MKRFLLVLPFLTSCLAAPVPIFDGKSLNGWEGDPALWRVQDGMIAGGSLTEKVTHNDFIATTKSYSNFDLRLKIKLTGTEGFLNSGVQIRSLRVPGSSEMSGYQVDYGKGWYGKLYDESRRNKVVGEAKDLAAANAAIHEGDWNEYRVRAEGPRIQSWINGVPALDYTEAEPNIAQDGHIGVQVHAGGKALVLVKDVTIEELPPTPNAPTWEKVGKPGAKKTSGRDISYNQVASNAKTPAEERACFTVPDGFEVQLVAAESEGVGKFVPLAFDQHGALWTTTAFEYPVDGNENPAAADALYASRAKDKVLIFDRDPKSPTGYASKPRVFAEGLAIPLGVLPYKNGCYVQHGHDIAFLEDTDGDGKADKRTVILTGFGVQDSHLFPHQFTRAPGGWIWMAQGAFNYGKVRRPEDPPEKATQFDQTRMAKFRPDGSGFTITSNGPCNIWGLVLNGEGEAFIQEANDFGYPVMPFHEYGNYPGCSDRQWKSYAPEFPGTAPDFRMGGTGLSGLALTDKNGPYPEAWRDMMLVANPITNKIQAIKMHRDGPYWKLDEPKDFLVSSDAWFRPVAINVGPDGCLYIVDWYNKIISHNEVPRNHPDRDKTRGRIWRVVAKGTKPFEVPDFTKLSGDELIAKLGGDSLAQSHLAWQAIQDRPGLELKEKLVTIAENNASPEAKRIQALWALGSNVPLATLERLFASPNRNVRQQALVVAPTATWPSGKDTESFLALHKDADPQVRAEFARWVSELPFTKGQGGEIGISWLLSLPAEPIAEPTAPSTRNGKPIKVREAYDREFQRYLVRMFLEPQAALLSEFLDSPSAEKLPVESRLLASLALEPKASAARVAKLLPQLQRPPGQEEVLRLAQFPEEPGVGEALRAALNNPATRNGVLDALLATRTRLDAGKLAPLLSDAAKQLLAGTDDATLQLGAQLAGGFQLTAVEPLLMATVKRNATMAIPALNALAEIRSGDATTFADLATSAKDPLVRNAALGALASSKASDAGERLLKLWPSLDSVQRRNALGRLTSTKPGAKAVVAAVRNGALKKEELDGPAVEKLQTLLGDDAELKALLGELESLFRPVLALNGKDDAFTEPGVTLDGPFTVECWLRLDPATGGRKAPTNDDGILGSPAQLDINFFGGLLRVWVGGTVHDAIVSKKPITPQLWTHVAVTRDAQGFFKLYQDGESVADQSKAAPQEFENVRIAWTAPKGGTAGAMDEFRIWNRTRTPDEIRRDFDRSFDPNQLPAGLVFHANGAVGWGKLHPGAHVVRTSDYPPVMSPAEATALDGKFAKYRALFEKPGDPARGKIVVAVCQACHLFKGQGASIGPDLSGVGAMGMEAILRNIITPNAAMENGYRIFRVETKGGDVIDAFYVSEDNEAIVVRQPGVPDRRIPKKEIVKTQYLRRSLMPEGLLDGFSPEQVSDLFAFLRTMK